jgi:hypothetical protein
VPSPQRQQESSLTDSQVNAIGSSRYQCSDGVGNDTGEKAILIEKYMIDGRIPLRTRSLLVASLLKSANSATF